ncbi:MAG: hypothetical protein SGILL_002872 [Bacillariaceae sp.]
MELILGGKLTAVRRSELQYTTAFDEGMTGESRQRRKRKTKEDSAVDTTLTIPTKKKASSKKNSTKISGDVSKKRGASGSGNKSKSKKQKGSQSTSTADAHHPGSSGNGLDIFERHRREFERSLVRLEKADVYQFFTDPHIPPEFDECYTSHDTAQVEESGDDCKNQIRPNDNMTTRPLTTAIHDGTTALTKQTDPSGIKHADGPPFNLVVLRKRLEHGRYTLDVERYETDERIKLMTPYYKSIRRKVPSPGKNLPQFAVQHKKGINWDLFRKDVVRMCDAAVERNPDFVGEGRAGSLRNAAEKTKELTEQIYDKIAAKQALEMEVANDAFRFNAAVQNMPNNEAAIQGKKWRREGEEWEKKTRAHFFRYK